MIKLVKYLDWKELCIHTINEAVEPISNILNEAGANGVIIEDPLDLTKKHREKFGELFALDPNNYPDTGIYLKAYFLDNNQLNEKIMKIKDKVEALGDYQINTGNPSFTLKVVQEADWENEWKKYFKPTSVTKRFTIVPVWEKYERVKESELLITIDPGMAFGTGTHPTTILSLQALEAVVEKNNKIIDVGSGSGILSIASILLGASEVSAFDLDEVAVNSTLANAKLSNLANKITVKQNDLLVGVNQQVHVIVSNILADILVDLVADAWDNLVDGGYFITSGIIDSKEKLVRDKLVESGFSIVKTNRMESWISFIAKKTKK